MKKERLAWLCFWLSIPVLIIGGLTQERILLALALLIFTPPAFLFLKALAGLVLCELPAVFRR